MVGEEPRHVSPGAMGHTDRIDVVGSGVAARIDDARPGVPLDILRAERAAKRLRASSSVAQTFAPMMTRTAAQSDGPSNWGRASST